MASVIGNLRINLGLDSAQFQTGLAKSQAGMEKFAHVAKIGLIAVAAAATAAGAGLAIAVKGAINHADELSKTAQKVGTTTEALSRLEYAAKLSDVSLEGLSTGFKKLNQNMNEVALGRGAQAASSFKALGIEVKNADGTLRDSGTVFAEIADRFSRMEDGAQKTALAMNIFGRSGADMIPLLNSGRAGLAATAAESDKLGATISTKTGRASEAFNDSLTRMQVAMQGVANRIAEAALPELNKLVETLSSDSTRTAFENFGSWMVSALNAGLGVLVTIINAIDLVLESIRKVSEQSTSHLKEMAASQLDIVGVGGITLNDVLNDPRNAETNRELFKRELSAMNATSITVPGGGDGGGGGGGGKPFTIDVPKLQSSAAAAAQSLGPLQDKFAELTQAGTDMGSKIGGALRGLIDGTKNWGDTLKDIGFSLLRLGLQGLGAAGGPVGGILSGLLGGLFGFADGGSFKVGGIGGVDSQLVAFKASPNETVSINKPGQSGGKNLVIHQNFNLTGTVGHAEVVNIAKSAGSAAVEAVKSAFPDWNSQIQQNGGIA